MSSCVYSLFGRHFGSELDLDNFLFSYRDVLNLDNISDIVFSQSPLQLATIAKIFELLKKSTDILEQRGELGRVVNEIKLRKRNGDFITPAERALAGNFYGVNYALGLMENVRKPGHMLTTSFNEKNFALELFKQWHNENSSSNEKGIQGKMLELLNRISGLNFQAGFMPDINTPVGIRNDESLPIEQRFPKSWNIFLNYIKQYWLGLGTAGSAVHYVAEQFWKGNTNVDNIYESLLRDVPQLGGEQVFKKAIVNNIILHMLRLKVLLEQRHGSNCLFFPEFVVTGDLIEDTLPNKSNAKLMGIIDLLVVDANGVPHIYDYKTSDKETPLWSQAKLDAFLSQTGCYKEMLKAWQLDTSETQIGIIPFLMEGFILDNNLNPYFLSIAWPDYKENEPFKSIQYIHGVDKLKGTSPFIESLRRYLGTKNSARNWTARESEDFINKFLYYLRAMFPNYNFLELLTEATIKDMVRYAKHDRNTGKWYLPTPNPDDRIYFDSKEDITELAIIDYHDKTILHNNDTLDNMKLSIINAVNDGEVDELPETKRCLNGQNNSNWFLDVFARYCNGDWECIKCAPLNDANILVLRNKLYAYYDFVGLTAINLATPLELKEGNKTVFGSFENDITSQYYGVDALTSDVGNVELMKTCLAINLAAKNLIGKDEKVGNIRIINPHLQQGRMPTSKLTLDNFNLLCNLLNEHEEQSTKLENNFANYNIEVLDASLKAKVTILELCEKVGTKRYKAIAAKHEKTGAEIRLTLDELNQIRRELEAADSALRRGEIDTSQPQGLMYLTVMLAIAEINGAFYTLELRDGLKMLMNITNPEVMNTANVRRLHTVINNANMQFTTKLNEYTSEWRKRYKKFKLDMGSNDVLNQGRRYMLDSDYYLFQNMWEFNQELGIFKFKDPWDNTNDLKDPERELLKWYLEALYDFRYKNTKEYSAEHRANLRADRNSTYYDVPLLKAENQEKIVNGKTKGMVNWFKRTMEWFKHPQKRASELIQKAHNEDDLKLLQLNAQNYEMIDRFEYSETGNRMRLIRENDEYYFSHSLDRIFYNYAAVKLRKEVMDEYVPIMKAVLVSLRGQELLDGVSLGNLTHYVGDFILAKVLDQSLVEEDFKAVSEVVGNLKMATTIGALGFNPKSGLFQVFEGVFKNFSRSVFKPMGESLFGLKEYMSAMKELVGDTPNHFKTVSMGLLLNEQYSINDQDVNQKADRLREGQNSLTFMGKAMWLVSAPDFLNRMGIFIAQMKKDDCYDAHELDLDNMTIHYNFKKDGRFKVFNDPTANKTSMEYRKLKALYERMILQFNEEGYTTIDARTGEVRRLQVGDDLPQAYTNKEARSIKSFADQLYGYYNHEDKMLLNSYLLGSMYTQFRTYWSSLRNRWWLKGKVYNQGHWEQMKTRDGELVYKKIITNEDGEDRIELVWGTDADPETMEPAMDWKGHYQEGFLQSFGSLVKCTLLDFNNDKGFIERFKDWKNGNGDESMGTTRRSNMSLMLHDLGVYAFISWIAGLLLSAIKERKKEDKYRNLTALEKFLRDFEKTFALSLASSVEDLGAFKDLTSPITDWTPPSLKFATNVYKDTKSWISGDKDFNKVMSENIGLIRQTENVLFL